MRMPRVRFTMRWMMVSVAIVAIIVAPKMVAARRAEIANLRVEYEAARDAHLDEALSISDTKAHRLRQWHIGLYQKYRRAPQNPWPPVEPDPPQPPDPRARLFWSVSTQFPFRSAFDPLPLPPDPPEPK